MAERLLGEPRLLLADHARRGQRPLQWLPHRGGANPKPNRNRNPNPGPNQAAWSKGQGYANAYLDIVNRAITSKVGNKFKPIEGTVDKAPAPVQAAAPAEAAPAEAAPAVEGTA